MSRYIDIDKAIDAISTYKGQRFGEDRDMYIKRILNELPFADVEPVRHGRWVGKTYKCSLCGKWIDPLQGDADMNYCPNCGARMDEKEQEHE